MSEYEYIEDTRTRDKCNALMTVTPEFTNGTYAYFLPQISQTLQDDMKANILMIFPKEGL